MSATASGGPIRVMQSFRAPRATTNPYITMLDNALGESHEVVHLRFDWRGALVGRYDVFHWHWPEGKLHGSTWWRTAGKCALTAALWLRLRLSRRIAVVRTVHNVELPDDGRMRTALLARIERDADLLIVLNSATRVGDRPSALIPHGHYRDWYAAQPRADRVRGRIGAFGGVRRYKNVSVLVDAYADAARRRPELSLEIGGRPSTPELGRNLEQRAQQLPNVDLQLRFLPDGELVRLATQSELVVLAYRFMHNSGSVLAALSLDRPVLVPRNPVNEALAREVGERWVHMYDGELHGDQLLAALSVVAEIPEGSQPDLRRRDWQRAAADHAAAYRRALTVKRGRA
ncbi:glycosyltransferase family protein [Agrococcus baldri]|uniref:GDP-mannose:glycolipid 4-beta-D-mannosyltransferase n=1 Tax=Agrococcus baldri TaxID=153730 RepID=A0AA87RE85_9MICO|nr:glycosyl transferase [Agrococcus baldri]GEK78820.1 GDP-mannose:glycolipid 4-beta-D-mannosyltransferase [Agrococcus baldri]